MTDQSFEKGNEMISRPVLFFFSVWLKLVMIVEPLPPHTHKKKEKTVVWEEQWCHAQQHLIRPPLYFMVPVSKLRIACSVKGGGREGENARVDAYQRKEEKVSCLFCISSFDSLLASFCFVTCYVGLQACFLVSFFFQELYFSSLP